MPHNAFDTYEDVAPQLTSPSTIVKNDLPTVTSLPYKIALIGEAPGKDEVATGRPFVGQSGRMLSSLLSNANVLRSACFVGNVCQRQPALNDLATFRWDGEEIQSGIKQLEADIATTNPNICVLLGATALHLAKAGNVSPTLRKQGKKHKWVFPYSISDWRGSLFTSSAPGPFLGRKCIAAYHPAYCLRQYKNTPILAFDLKKARRHAETPTFVPRQRTLLTDLSFNDLCNQLDNVIYKKPTVSADLEGWWNNLTCISFATEPNFAFCVPFTHLNGTSFWSVDEEMLLWSKVAQILSNPSIPKVWQNGLYDRFVLQYGHNIVVRGNQDDTMLKFHEKWCELEKSLGFQISVLIDDEPFYKTDRKTDDEQTYYAYCCRDAATTFEINERLDSLLDTEQKAHYRRNHDLLNPLLFMELQGIRYDIPLAKQRLAQTLSHIYPLQAELDALSGHGFAGPPTLGQVQSHLCRKSNSAIPYAGKEAAYRRAVEILSSNAVLSPSEVGELSTLCGAHLNTDSSKQMRDYVYNTLNCPPQYNRTTKALTTDYEALLKINKKVKNRAIEVAIEIGVLRTRAQMLEIHADPDGRVRCGYNIVGTETGRLSCYTSPTGSGYNLQTIPAENSLRDPLHPLHQGMRDLFTADPGYYLFQCDLSGADGWTVGAYMASLGDSTMLDDLKAGIKPAKVVCLILRHGAAAVQGKSRPEIKEMCKTVEKEQWDYYACKQGIWMTCYMGGPDRLANLTLVNSEGKVDMSRSEVRTFQAAVFVRYRVQLWHNWLARQLAKQPVLCAPNGFKRRFFDRSTEILGQALAHMPQVITTYATNTAIYRLWTDRDNHLGMGLLRCTPLHQVHDALLGQFRIEDVSWAKAKLHEWFNNPITIAGQRIIIPFEGQYGTNWALDNSSKVGDI